MSLKGIFPLTFKSKQHQLSKGPASYLLLCLWHVGIYVQQFPIFYKEFIQNEYYSNHYRGHIQFFQQCNIKRERIRERLRLILLDPLEAVVVGSVRRASSWLHSSLQVQTELICRRH